MSTLYIRLPSKAATANAAPFADLACPFAFVSVGGAVEREGVSMLSQLTDVLGKAKRVVLLLAASDVTLLTMKVPPLSGARLKAALPSLVEEQLISDPAECTLVAGPAEDGMRTIAVVHHAWLELLGKTLLELGARNIAAVPMQLCLPYQPGMVSAAVAAHEGDIEVAVRLSEDAGIGLSIASGAPEEVAQEVVQTLCAVVPDGALTLYVPQAQVPLYNAALSTQEADERIVVYADSWTHWIAGAQDAPINLMAGIGLSSGSGINWSRWRWPLGLAAACLLINMLGLNIDWLRMKREATLLQASMIQIYKTAYPKETAIIDPLAQMRQKIALAKHDAGEASPDDFVPLTAAFGEAWENVMQGRTTPGIAALEYAERSLVVRLKADGEAPLAAMKAALAAHNLTLEQRKAGEWQIRSAR